MTVAQPTGAVSHHEVDWHTIDWEQVHRTVRRLQARIVKATQELRSRVPHGAFERLERYELKGSRTVLRGLGGSNAPRLPDPAQESTARPLLAPLPN